MPRLAAACFAVLLGSIGAPAQQSASPSTVTPFNVRAADYNYFEGLPSRTPTSRSGVRNGQPLPIYGPRD